MAGVDGRWLGGTEGDRGGGGTGRWGGGRGLVIRRNGENAWFAKIGLDWIKGSGWISLDWVKLSLA